LQSLADGRVGVVLLLRRGGRLVAKVEPDKVADQPLVVLAQCQCRRVFRQPRPHHKVGSGDAAAAVRRQPVHEPDDGGQCRRRHLVHEAVRQHGEESEIKLVVRENKINRFFWNYFEKSKIKYYFCLYKDFILFSLICYIFILQFTIYISVNCIMGYIYVLWFITKLSFLFFCQFFNFYIFIFFI
jgi:hypothetical protein